MSEVQRLSTATLSSDRTPPYDRSGAAPIVHIGVGAFARAHLCTYADALLRAGTPAMVRGVSLSTTRAEQQLEPQDCLFTVSEREPGNPHQPAVIGSIASVRSGVDAAIAEINDPTTSLVTITVTEKAYDLDPSDLEPGSPPISLPAVIAHALVRRDRSLAVPIIAPLDNLPDNGALLRARVLQVAQSIDVDAAKWIDTVVPFVSSVVDRVVPATSEADLQQVSEVLELSDLAAVVCERHKSWCIERVPGLPPLADVGVEVVDDIEPYQRRKLWLLNGPHSAIAYLGLLMGHDSIADATRDPRVAAIVELVIDDVLAVADLPASLDGREFAQQTLRRFANSALAHRCRQVATDGSKKLPQRILPVVARRRAAGLSTDRFAMIVAIWSMAVSGLTVHDVVMPELDDPVRSTAQELMRSMRPSEVTRAVLGDEIDDRFGDEIDRAVDQLTRSGIAALDSLR